MGDNKQEWEKNGLDDVAGDNGNSKKNAGKDSDAGGFGKAVLGVFLLGTLAVFLILTITLLSRNGVFEKIQEKISSWKTELSQKKAKQPKQGEKEETCHFGPSGNTKYTVLELLGWTPEELSDWQKAADEAAKLQEGMERNLEKSPVTGQESWWQNATRLRDYTSVYAVTKSPLFSEPEAKTDVVGYAGEGEEFRLCAIIKGGWYVLSDGKFTFCSPGEFYTLTVPQKADLAAEKERESVNHEVTVVLQNPELVYGCEITSLAMLLGYYGLPEDKCVLSDRYLKKGEWGKADFREAFIGNPREKKKSAGCYAPVIADAANAYLSEKQSKLTAEYAEGLSFSELLNLVEYSPLLVWTTMELQPSCIEVFWEIDGKELYWQNMEHCIVLTGFDMEKEVFYASDPMYGECEYDMQLFMLRFQTMGSQGVWLK